MNLPPHLPFYLIQAACWVVLVLGLRYWLRDELTPKRFLTIFESHNVLSSRLILAWVLAIFGMCMYAAGRMNDNGLWGLLGWVVGLFGIGGVVNATAAIKGDTNIKAEKVDHLSVGGKAEPKKPTE
jgi:hypothetical protein